ncbi:MAG TPA: malectin domain-containing carbohydrate-binding protein [Candidatus Sphingobacterium stercoripullorum]|nr:malectin domain-containing carbohydrate-binding protein [Candidatus Sphingobacterium stercoripullorum]
MIVGKSSQSILKAFKYFICIAYCIQLNGYAQDVNLLIPLNEQWKSTFHASDSTRNAGFQQSQDPLQGEWKEVSVPHNWDQYSGYLRQLHGNLHGYAWYRKTFVVNEDIQGNHAELFFEGVSSYATVWLNGTQVGYHEGGRTTFTVEVTDQLNGNGQENILALRVDHPESIRDLPWVDGGCSPERGFSEGSQPFGIFRPVSLRIKNKIHIPEFGVHCWNEETLNFQEAKLHATVDVQNKTRQTEDVRVVFKVRDSTGAEVAQSEQRERLQGNATKKIAIDELTVKDPELWYPDNPYLYTIHAHVYKGDKLVDQQVIDYGIRYISWPKGLKPNDENKLLVNGKPFFIHGIAEYEHKLGNSHAFHPEEIKSRVEDMKSLGFNAFREAHQPHNLVYQQEFDRLGLFFWSQFTAHIWFDNPQFRENFKRLLRQWVLERRNSPSVFLWGLQNESVLPADFAEECRDIIREMDPTASIQRLVVSCNGGDGTDWNVPQNWTGTYGGDHHDYGEDLKKQLLVGEYGAWRTMELHDEGPYLANTGPYSENRFTDVMETKLRLADSVKDEVVGHFMWLWNSHDNPGRIQGGEGFRDLDKIGPVNYKGLVSPWGEPTDAYYMYMANYSKKEQAVLYIDSHTWPNRWMEPGIKDNIRIYSNCDEVELFNDIQGSSLGVLKNPGRGKHFEFSGVQVQYNVLYAEGRNNGQVVARDTIVLSGLAQSPNYDKLYTLASEDVLQQQSGLNYLIRVNAGGGDYRDHQGNIWQGDQPYSGDLGWGSISWTDRFEGVNPFFASQRRTFEPIKNTKDWSIFQSFRYGQDQLAYQFDVPNGQYVVELYFAEPWAGRGGDQAAMGKRTFDVAINNRLVENRLDIFKESGYSAAIKRSYEVEVRDNKILVDFPTVYSGQAVISAISIASKGGNPAQTVFSKEHFNLNSSVPLKVNGWLDIKNNASSQEVYELSYLPSFLYGADYVLLEEGQRNIDMTFKYPTSLYVIADEFVDGFEQMDEELIDAKGKAYKVSRKLVDKGERTDYTPAGDYMLAFHIQSGIQPAYDLKESVDYKAVDANRIKNGNQEHFQNQDRIAFEDGKQGMVEWKIQVGVADVYALTFKYHNRTKEVKTGYYELYDIEGKMLKDKTKVDLMPTREGKWNYLDENSSTMINAGTYFVRFYSDGGNAILVDNLEVK